LALVYLNSLQRDALSISAEKAQSIDLRCPAARPRLPGGVQSFSHF